MFFPAKYYTNSLEKLYLLGARAEDDCLLIEQIRNTNKGALLSFIISLLCTLSTTPLIPVPYIYIPLVFSFSYLLTIWISYLGFHTIASLSSWGISLIIFFWLAGAYGKESNAYLLFIIAEMIAIFNVDIRKSKQIVTILSVPPLLAAISYLTHFSLFKLPIQEEKLAALNPIFFFTVVISAGVLLLVYARNMQASIEKLQEKFVELAQTHDELQKTNEELDQFVYSVSHDLRAPISSVMGLVDLCTNDKANVDTYLELQRKSVNRLDNFIKDILHYARNSRMEIAPVALNFEQLIKEVFDNQAYSESAQDMQLNINVNGNSIIYTDEFRLNVILSNIISNAIRYRKKTGIQSFIHFEVFLSPTTARIEIADNGIGIKAEHLPNIFQMFYRAHSKSIGSGLGLYIVKEAVTKLKGSVEAYSIEGKGSTFILNIPNLKEQRRMNSENTLLGLN